MKYIFHVHVNSLYPTVYCPHPHTTQDLEELDRKVAAVGSGPEKDYYAQVSRLLKKYNIAMPDIQVRAWVWVCVRVADSHEPMCRDPHE